MSLMNSRLSKYLQRKTIEWREKRKLINEEIEKKDRQQIIELVRGI